MNTIAAVAIALGKALELAFASYARAVLSNAQALAQGLCRQGLQLVSGGTSNHLMVIDTLASVGLGGAGAERALEQAGITTNKQLIPDDPNPATSPSGVRLGTPAATTRGFGRVEMELLAEWIGEALRHAAEPARLAELRVKAAQLCRRFPIPGRVH
jgi:glycine hydroxymethyltransferase